jgi:hypothetical protein
MTHKLTSEQQTALDEAFGTLQLVYNPGDDGDAVRLALNAIAGILGGWMEIKVAKDDSLKGVLDTLDAEDELQVAIAELYEIAQRGAYGEGLTKKSASRINDLLREVDEPLSAFIRKARSKASGRVKVRTRSTARSRRS